MVICFLSANLFLHLGLSARDEGLFCLRLIGGRL